MFPKTTLQKMPQKRPIRKMRKPRKMRTALMKRKDRNRMVPAILTKPGMPLETNLETMQ